MKLEQRLKILANAKTILIKVGSAVLADAQGLNEGILGSLADQIAAIRSQKLKGLYRKIILVSSGAVAAGKAILKNNGKNEFNNYKKAKQAIAAVGQCGLMRAWSRAFAKNSITVGQILLTREDLRSRDRFHMAANTFAELLDWDVIPIVNENDTVSVTGLQFGDNDCLASLLVNLAEADIFINLTSAKGVLEANPQEHPEAKILKEINDISQLDLDCMCGAKTEMGSGGMHSKLLAARRVAQLGVPTLILPGRMENILIKAFAGDMESGTWVNAEEKNVSRRKFWLAYQSEPAGSVEVDGGAARALLEEGRSLLPGGVLSVSGDFNKGELLRIKYQGKNIGVGFSNYNADELNKICGLKRHEVAAILGKAKYPDVIHRDNLLIDAAVTG